MRVVLALSAGLLVLFGWWYLRGLRRVRDHQQGRRSQRWRPWLLLAALVVTVAVTAPPLGEILEERLSTHMTQHMVLIMVAAPLLALSAPAQPLLAGMPRALRSRVVRLGRRLPLGGLLTPHFAWAAHIGLLWAWHMPAAYDAALRDELLHYLEHACFLGTAWLFWWHLATLTRHRLRGPVALLYVVAAIPPGAALGALLTFPDHALYPAQAAHALAAGINPLLDQRIGGLVMWVPLDLAYMALAVWLFLRWFRSLEREQGGGDPLPVVPDPIPGDPVAGPSTRWR
jgi:cytochrome c oxidase assembly factor CtaG